MSLTPPTDEGRTYRRWILRELELLVSAGLIFALFQLPGVLDRGWGAVEPHLGGVVFHTVFTGYYVATLVAYALIATITAHFLLRAFGIALLGMQSIFPDGIDWSKLKYGPLVTGFADQRFPSLEELEERIDRLASSLFGFLFLFLAVILSLALTTLAGVVGAFVVAAISPRHTFFEVLSGAVLIALGLLFGMQLVAFSIDKLTRSPERREKLPGWLIALGRRLLWVQHVLTLGSLANLLMWHFASRLSRGKASGILIGFTYALIGIFAVASLAKAGVIGFDSYEYYPPRVDEGSLQARHYDNLRPAGVPVDIPTLGRDVVEGPYLRLFVPYDAHEDNERIEALCPDLEPIRGPGVFLRPREPVEEGVLVEVHDCLDRIYEIELDGQALEDPDFLFHTHPDSGVAGRLAYLPTADLTSGRHLLTVRHAPLPETTSEDEDEDADEFFLPFWK